MKDRIVRRTAVLLMCALLMCFAAGCGGGDNAEGPGHPAVTNNPAGTEEPASSSGVTTDELLEMINELTEQVEALQAQRALPEEVLYDDYIDITDEAEGEDLLNRIVEKESQLLAVPPNGEQVQERDWSKYTQPRATANLNASELKLYEEMDAACMMYLTQPGHYVDHKGDRVISKPIDYRSLGISRQDALNLFRWFKYQNPQYYFTYRTLFFDSMLFVVVEDFAVQMEDEAKVTNEMFDKLDRWIAECTNDNMSTLEKVRAINKKICENTIYSPAVAAGDSSASAGKNQTMYSVLMTNDTVCAGYSRTFDAMANAAGLESYGMTGPGHAWNAVRFDDGKIYFVDVCWNDMDNGYNEDWLGVGTQFAWDNDSHHYHSLDDTAQAYGPEIAEGVYVPGSAPAAPWVAAPVARVTGGGSALAKVSWDPVPGAEGYLFYTYNGSELIKGYLVGETTTSMYTIFPRDVDTVTVKVCAFVTKDGERVTSEPSVLTVSPDPSGSSLPKPSDIRMSPEDGISVGLENGTGGWFLLTFGDDESLLAMKSAYQRTSTAVDWSDSWGSGTDSYFEVMFIRISDDYTRYSDPVAVKYNRQSGMTLLNTSGSALQTVTKEYDEGTYTGEMRDGLREGTGRMEYTSGNVYEGTWKNDRYDGQGKYTWAAGDVYEGSYENGRRSGQGTYTWASGSVFVGAWKDNQRNGTGTMTYTSGNVYEGEWKNSKRDGHGVFTWASGKTYDGQWKTGKMNGSGTLTWPDGTSVKGEWQDDLRIIGDGTYGIEYNDSSYVGEVKDGKREGTGTLRLDNGAVYEGSFKDDAITGQGVATMADGTVYEGEWKDGKADGQGTRTWTDGRVYTGAWKNGKRIGYGTMTYPDGKVERGEWADDAFIGEYTPSGSGESVTKEYKNGTYTGEMQDGMRHGTGRMEYSNGDVYDGQWKDDRRVGLGVYTWSDGSVYVGQWDGDRTGIGRMEWNNGCVYQGEWKDSMPDGEGMITWANGACYIGEWKENKRDGFGTYIESNGDTYSGEFVADRREGQGRMTYANGTVEEGLWKNNRYEGPLSPSGSPKTQKFSDGTYTGEMRNGMRNGYGRMEYDSDGRVFDGEWKNDKRWGIGDVTWINGNFYTGEWNDVRNGSGWMEWAKEGMVYGGEWRDNVPHGVGTVFWKGGDSYTGEWQNNVRAGFGIYTWANGDLYVGEFADNEREGFGILISVNGKVQQGQWKDGKFVG